MNIGPNSTRDVIIRTADVAAAVEFYSGVLGFPRVDDAAPMVGFDTGAFILYVEQGEPQPPVFEFLVADVEAAKEQLVGAGCRVVEDNPSVPRCYIADPFGLVFNLGKAREADW